jgi:3-deoxy-D-manno-octulosonate 8-phosphate phosphatase (KDO 8-P phosphatase)
LRLFGPGHPDGARAGGDRAVAEACLHIMEKFFTPFNPAELPNAQHKLSGEWTV